MDNTTEPTIQPEQTLAKEEDMKLPKLTIKQKKWIAKYLETGNGTEAALHAYDTKDRVTAAHISAENVRKLSVPLRVLAEAMGIDTGVILRTAKEGLSATTESAKGNTIPDYHARAKYVQILGKLTGLEQPAQQLTQINLGFPTKVEFVEGEIQDDN